MLTSMLRRDLLKAALLAQAPVPTPAPPKARITSSVMLWTLKGSFEEKLEIAAKAGIQSVELVSEHVDWSDQQINDAKKRARGYGLGMDTIIATPNWGGRPVSMVDPAQRDNFLKDV